MIIIEIKNLHYEYSEKVLFEDFNYIFRPGINLITGPNGTGKSTLLNIIAGNLKLDKNEAVKSGTIEYYYDDWNISDKFIENRLDYVGYIFQEEFLIDSLTFEENLFIPLRFLGFSKRKRYNLYSSQIYHELEQIFPNQKEEDILTKKAGKLSGGEKKKLSILRAIISAPKLLLIDEPTNHIDNDSLEWFVMLMKKYTEQNITIIMITHSIEIQEMITNSGVDFSTILQLPFNRPNDSFINKFYDKKMRTSENYYNNDSSNQNQLASNSSYINHQMVNGIKPSRSQETLDKGKNSNKNHSDSNLPLLRKQKMDNGIQSSVTSEIVSLDDNLNQNSSYNSKLSEGQSFENILRTSISYSNIVIDYQSNQNHDFSHQSFHEDQEKKKCITDRNDSIRSSKSFWSNFCGPLLNTNTHSMDKTNLSKNVPSQNEESQVKGSSQQNYSSSKDSNHVKVQVKLDKDKDKDKDKQ